MTNLIEEIEKLIEVVSGDNLVFKMNQVTLDNHFGPKNKDKYPVEFHEKVRGIPVRLDDTLEINIIYLVDEPKPKDEKVSLCDCGVELNEYGWCDGCDFE